MCKSLDNEKFIWAPNTGGFDCPPGAVTCDTEPSIPYASPTNYNSGHTYVSGETVNFSCDQSPYEYTATCGCGDWVYPKSNCPAFASVAHDGCEIDNSDIDNTRALPIGDPIHSYYYDAGYELFEFHYFANVRINCFLLSGLCSFLFFRMKK